MSPRKKRSAASDDGEKVTVRIYLSSDVIEALRAIGPGWQARADEILRAEFVGK